MEDVKVVEVRVATPLRRGFPELEFRATYPRFDTHKLAWKGGRGMLVVFNDQLSIGTTRLDIYMLGLGKLMHDLNLQAYQYLVGVNSEFENPIVAHGAAMAESFCSVGLKNDHELHQRSFLVCHTSAGLFKPENFTALPVKVRKMLRVYEGFLTCIEAEDILAPCVAKFTNGAAASYKVSDTDAKNIRKAFNEVLTALQAA